jgi:hypothetical protein
VLLKAITAMALAKCCDCRSEVEANMSPETRALNAALDRLSTSERLAMLAAAVIEIDASAATAVCALIGVGSIMAKELPPAAQRMIAAHLINEAATLATVLH